VVPENKPIRFTELACPAIDHSPNQPNVFYDPKSAESASQYFSRGWQDDHKNRFILFLLLTGQKRGPSRSEPGIPHHRRLFGHVAAPPQGARPFSRARLHLCRATRSSWAPWS